MNKHELTSMVKKVLDQNNARKFVHIEKRILKITDVTYKDETTAGRISVQAKDKLVKYTMEDVGVILDAIAVVIREALMHGETVNVLGLGRFFLKYRRAKKMKKPDTGEWITIPEKYVVAITPSAPLREAADIYTMSKQNNPEGFILPDPIYDQFETPDEVEDEPCEETEGDEVDATEY